MNDYFYQDTDDKKCFDIYAHLNHLPNREAVLSDIKRGLELNLANNAMIGKVLTKLLFYILSTPTI